jgi:hypothetical protein
LDVNNYNRIILDSDLNDEGCKVLNEILLENKKIEIIDLRSKFSKIIKRYQGNIKWIKLFKRIIKEKSIFKRNQSWM